ncbi:MAG: hypothetical protein FJX23_09445 [Alphaproteobacteria bacterium]|nr:hypothetical protein [Alphaproteobacteria bacterium]
MEWIGFALTLLLLGGLVTIIVLAIRDKKIYIDTEFSLRTLPAGRLFELDGHWVNDDEEGFSKHWETTASRYLTFEDARLAYKTFVLLRAKDYTKVNLSSYMSSLLLIAPDLVDKLAARNVFYSMHDFVTHVALFDDALTDTIKNRDVDPAEYDLDKSGWDDNDEN